MNGAIPVGASVDSQPCASTTLEGRDKSDQEKEITYIPVTCDEPAYPPLPPKERPSKYEPGTWKAGTIRLVPLRVPLLRRKQTAAVLFHSILVFLLMVTFCCLWANPLLWPMLVTYSIRLATSTAATDGKLSGRSEWLRSLSIWTHFAGYFPMKLHKTHNLSPDRKFLMGYHPHGIISHGAWCAFATNALGFSEKFPGITNTLLTLESNLRVPLFRDWILAMGLRSVSKESISNILSTGGPNNKGQGRAVTIIIGGAREILEARPGSMRLVLKDRKGFVKMALQTGADLVPVIGFGENDLYSQLSFTKLPTIYKLQRGILKLLKTPIPIFYGRGLFNYDFGLMPYRQEVNIVVGKPIQVDKFNGSRPFQDEVDRIHALYIEEVEKLYTAYKEQFENSGATRLQTIS